MFFWDPLARYRYELRGRRADFGSGARMRARVYGQSCAVRVHSIYFEIPSQRVLDMDVVPHEADGTLRLQLFLSFVWIDVSCYIKLEAIGTKGSNRQPYYEFETHMHTRNT